MGEWNPWHWIGHHRPDITVITEHHLPTSVSGIWMHDRIWLCRSLGQAGRRSVLTHEIQHLLRGMVGKPFRDREEAVVDELAARRLIELNELIDALRATRDPHELADALWCDLRTVTVRCENLDPIEVAQIEHALEDLWIP